MYKKLIEKKEKVMEGLIERSEGCSDIEEMKDITRQIVGNRKELAELRSVCARTAVIGDCSKPARIMHAVRDGMFAALDIV